MSLPARYAALIAKRPELAVPMLQWDPGDPCGPDDDPLQLNPPMWVYKEQGPYMEAEALILAHFIRKLPNQHSLQRFGPGVWLVINHDTGDEKWEEWNGADPLDCLLAYWEQQP